ncbi:hypothetical protein A3E97_04235 [Candidatus Uhrbacteria bacterium RIFCSPHIGHO2_12_FULL_47_12]|uniref:Thioredoxin domain-containing protein n=1 Tax=Candidatus Uhrbacteria bacterium RIFCSPLOWO2_02_FULL_48_18 TaxID=1802408 RepID=A0A1F7V7W1_9BACT|nr:MAG: hypothetical protein A3E97_04235 [Candidatus Uhrbacteria bacterium RIFCSPHIGHO2_12_FULL_47_12]OGL80319.1 MAG: hypothetical protein A3B20_02715 [Candidatus Uhrbacteria bacterium RIFCSPLOWO2_01_FULL_47_17]OGL86177.1 MAG: hypothetical protein A3I41_01205 [Candidatus Uhrbacteria bacterium RIFCSPLOWO2_02_FULL_48_18]OGL93515.1 MAG: hypothetical protein A3H12_03845 [Candidatus Uhrbacteria bacterium RIFCSPLOWO2_12_FULL_47_9]
MRDRLLAFLVIGVLAIMVFVFFFIRTQPIPLPKPKITASDSNAQKVPTVTFVDPVKGAPNAKVTLVEYADFECVACKQLIPIIDIAMKTFPNDVRLVWKDVPNDSAHPQATPASVAAHCAHKQGKFWEYSSMLFDRQTYLSETQYTQIATELGLNVKTFTTCMTNKDTLPIVMKNLQEGLDLGVIATPTLFVGSKPFVGVPTVDDLTKAIADELASQK